MDEVKYVAWIEMDKDGNLVKTNRIERIIEKVTPKKINKWRFAWYFITNKHFRFLVFHTINYALRFHDSVSGEGASDVVLYNYYANTDYKIYDWSK